MRHDATIPDPSLPERRRDVLRHLAEASLLAGIFAAMAFCLAAGPRLAALLLQ